MTKNNLVKLYIQRLNEHVDSFSVQDYGRIEELAWLLLNAVNEDEREPQ